MLELHHIPGSRSCRVRWLLEELGLEYELVPHALGGASLRSPDYRALNPLGLVPTLEDAGVVLHESGAIVQYLIERYAGGRFEPAIGSPERAAYLQWFHWGEATLMGPLTEIMRNRFVLPEPERSERTLANARKRFARVLRALSGAVAGVDHLVSNEFSAADIMVVYGLDLALRVGELPDAAVEPRRYHATLSRRPAFERAFGSGF